MISLSVHDLQERCWVLGPGVRSVIWVRGCRLRCPECVSPDALPFEGGTTYTIEGLVERLDALEDVAGLTLSGGEPMDQAEALVALVDALRARRDWSVLSYTGYQLEHLRRRGNEHQRALIDRLDLLVDGPYRAELSHGLRWRGSANQRIHNLSGRHDLLGPDESAGLEVREVGGVPNLIGVPPIRGLVPSLEGWLEHEGIHIVRRQEEA